MEPACARLNHGFREEQSYLLQMKPSLGNKGLKKHAGSVDGKLAKIVIVVAKPPQPKFVPFHKKLTSG
jgi:hypothetical protein